MLINSDDSLLWELLYLKKNEAIRFNALKKVREWLDK